MRRAAAWCLAGLLILAAGCGKKDTVILLKTLPEIDKSALDAYVDFGAPEISTDRLWVNLPGKAKQDLGRGVPVEVTRYMGAERLDTITAGIARKDTTPAGGEEGGAPGATGPMAESGPRPVPPIAAGDEVVLSIDATTTKGVITKLVLTPMGG